MLAPAPRFARGGHGGGGGGNDPVVESVDPTEGEQGQTLEILVSGQAFEEGDEVALGIDGTASSEITTNATTFVGPNTLRANITIAATAEVMSYDIMVIGNRGRKGIGTALFAVKLKPHQNAVATDLGTLDGDNSYASDINENGIAVGSVGSSGDRVVVWDTRAADPQIVDWGAGWATAINDLGQITIIRDFEVEPHAFVLDTSTGEVTELEPFTELGHTSTQAQDINDAGQVVGWSQAWPSAASTGFLWDGTTMMPLTGLSSSSMPVGINSVGHIVGTSGGGTVIWLDPLAPPIDLGAGLGWSKAHAVSDPTDDGVVYVAGQVGESASDPGSAAVWTVDPDDGSFTLEILDPSADAMDVNRNGDAVGWIGPSERAFLWRTAGPGFETFELGGLTGRGFSWADGINDLGEIVGWGSYTDHGKDRDTVHATLWTLLP
jgi:probable HAF family extracellular repeat protein